MNQLILQDSSNKPGQPQTSESCAQIANEDEEEREFRSDDLFDIRLDEIEHEPFLKPVDLYASHHLFTLD
jgi:hypothetical protein